MSHETTAPFLETPLALACAFCTPARSQEVSVLRHEVHVLRLDLVNDQSRATFLQCPECSRRWAVIFLAEAHQNFERLDREARDL